MRVRGTCILSWALLSCVPCLAFGAERAGLAAYASESGQRNRFVDSRGVNGGLLRLGVSGATSWPRALGSGEAVAAQAW